MNELYELNKDKNKYKILKYNLNRIYELLSGSEVKTDLITASNSLQNNYTINNYCKYSKSILSIEDELNNNREIIKDIINDVDYKINSIDKDIREIDNGKY